jgi:hypothetical protein
MQQVIILHGWSDTSKSFIGLTKFLKAKGYNALPIWLGDYISLDDDVAIKDVAKRMKAVIDEMIASGKIDIPFDMIVHSTGGLVAREWLASYYNEGQHNCPLKRLVMLAPANFGSRLASMGQSMLGRLVKGWNNWFHTGMRMLQCLELSSPYQWDLVKRDLLFELGPTSTDFIYGENGVWPFVIVGSQPYTNPLRSILNEDGADGTVRVPAANMNVFGATINFAEKEDAPEIDIWPQRLRDNWSMPLTVLHDQDHTTITQPLPDTLLANLILEALSCPDFITYQAIGKKWEKISEETALLDKPSFHQFIQVNVHVVDDHGDDVPDFFLEFYGPPNLKTRDKLMAYFHNEVLQHVHVNSQNASYRCFYVDRTDLYNNFYSSIQLPDIEKRLWMSISAAPLGDNISYFNNYKTGAGGELLIHQFDPNGLNPNKLTFRLRRNSTHFVKIVIPRTPHNKVFQLTKQ